jgi:hypothetical protein
VTVDINGKDGAAGKDGTDGKDGAPGPNGNYWYDAMKRREIVVIGPSIKTKACAKGWEKTTGELVLWDGGAGAFAHILGRGETDPDYRCTWTLADEDPVSLDWYDGACSPYTALTFCYRDLPAQ